VSVRGLGEGWVREKDGDYGFYFMWAAVEVGILLT